jgi:hypothetical protein
LVAELLMSVAEQDPQNLRLDAEQVAEIERRLVMADQQVSHTKVPAFFISTPREDQVADLCRQRSRYFPRLHRLERSSSSAFGGRPRSQVP